MILDSKTAIQLYFKEVTLDISEEDLTEIIKLYFDFIREEIESGRLEQVRLKYFGSFKPMFGKIKHLQKNINWDKFNPKEKERYVKLFENFERISEENNTGSQTDV